MRYRLHFTDELYPCSILLKEAKWRRIIEAFPNCKFGGPSFSLAFKDEKKQSPFSSKTFVEAMEKMSRFPALIARVFPNHQVSPVGFYALYFCLNGNVQAEGRREIILDDFVPLDNYG